MFLRLVSVAADSITSLSSSLGVPAPPFPTSLTRVTVLGGEDLGGSWFPYNCVRILLISSVCSLIAMTAFLRIAALESFTVMTAVVVEGSDALAMARRRSEKPSLMFWRRLFSEAKWTALRACIWGLASRGRGLDVLTRLLEALMPGDMLRLSNAVALLSWGETLLLVVAGLDRGDPLATLGRSTGLPSVESFGKGAMDTLPARPPSPAVSFDFYGHACSFLFSYEWFGGCGGVAC